MEPKKKKSFVGNVKPHIELDGMALKVVFGERFALEEWQTAHPQFKYALQNGWVVSSDRNGLVLNTLEGQVREAPYNTAQDAVTSDVSEASAKSVAAGMDPALVHEALQRQSLVLNQFVSKHSEPQQDSPLLKELVEQQRSLIGLLSQQRSESTSPDVVNLLKEIKDSLANPKAAVTYNKGSAQTGQAEDTFKVVEVQPEKFVSKVEDLNVKSANVVTEKHTSGGVDDALAALKKLKGK